MQAAGKLWHWLQFEARAEPVDDGYGNTISGVWTEQFTVHAGLQFLRGSEQVIAARLEGRSPVVILLRSSQNARRITHEWRAKDLRTGTIYQIKESPRPSADRAFVEMLAESGVAG